MKPGPKIIDEILGRLLEGPERPLGGHEIISEFSPGGVEPGSYRVESHRADGSVKVETFRVDGEGRVTDVRVTVKRAKSRGRKKPQKLEPRPKRTNTRS